MVPHFAMREEEEDWEEGMKGRADSRGVGGRARPQCRPVGGRDVVELRALANLVRLTSWRITHLCCGFLGRFCPVPEPRPIGLIT